MTLPEVKCRVFNNLRLVRPAPANRGLPWPRMTGFTMIRSSSSRPVCSRLAVSVELPGITMSLPGCCLSLASSSSTWFADDLRAGPGGLRQGLRDDDLGSGVHRLRDHWVGLLAGGRGPESGHALIGHAAEHQRAGLAKLRQRELAELLVDVMPGQGLVRVGVIAISAGHHEREHLPHGSPAWSLRAAEGADDPGVPGSSP